MTYLKEAFDPVNFEHAKNIVLTPDPKDPFKFDTETEFFIEKIKNEIEIKEEHTVLDFGCGVGRVSKELIKTFGCKVVGVDISESMLTFAKLYVASLSKFTPLKEYKEKNSIDIAFSIFVLQHVENPIEEIENLYDVIKPGGKLILLNEDKRFVPSGVDENRFVIWQDDSFNIYKEIENKFSFVKEIKFKVPYREDSKRLVIYQK